MEGLLILAALLLLYLGVGFPPEIIREAENRLTGVNGGEIYE